MKSLFVALLMGVFLYAPESMAEGTLVTATPIRQINVNGEGRIKVKPDKAELQFTVYAEHKMLKDAKAAADAKLEAVMTALQKLEIPKGDIQTNYSSIMPRYNYVSTSVLGSSTNKQVFEAYEVNHTLTVTIKQLELVGVVMQKLTDIGIDRLGNVQYGLLDERPVKEKVLAEAIAHARRKADIAAAAMTVSVGKVLTFSEAGAQFTPMPMMAVAMDSMAMGKSMAAAPSAPPAGDIEVTQSVSISYEIKD